MVIESLEEPLTCMILEEIRIPYIVSKNLHRFMSANFLKFEDRRALRCTLGKKSRA